MQPVRPNASKLVGAGCQMLFGLVFSGMALFFLLMIWTTGAPWYFLLFDVPFLAVGFGLMAYGGWHLIVRPSLVGMAFGPASAELSPQTARPGDTINFRYEQAARRNVDVRRVLIQLVLREHAAYRRGTDTYNVYHSAVIDQYEAPGRPLQAGDLFSETCALTVPVDGMHSFNAPRNKLNWLVKVEIDTPGAPDVSEEIAFTVVPDVAR